MHAERKALAEQQAQADRAAREKAQPSLAPTGSEVPSFAKPPAVDIRTDRAWTIVNGIGEREAQTVDQALPDGRTMTRRQDGSFRAPRVYEPLIRSTLSRVPPSSADATLQRRPPFQLKGQYGLAGEPHLSREVLDLYAAARLTSGDPRRVKITVKEDRNGLLMYCQHLVMPLRPVVGAVAPGPEAGKAVAATVGKPGATIKIGDLLQGIKSGDGSRLFQRLEAGAAREASNPVQVKPLQASHATAALTSRLDQLNMSNKVRLAITTLIDGDDRIAGSYRDRLITLAMDSDQPAGMTINHEVIHPMRELGLFATMSGAGWRRMHGRTRR